MAHIFLCCIITTRKKQKKKKRRVRGTREFFVVAAADHGSARTARARAREGKQMWCDEGSGTAKIMGYVASRVVRFLVHEGWKDKPARIKIAEIDVERDGCTQMLGTYKSVCHKCMSIHANEVLVQRETRNRQWIIETMENTHREKKGDKRLYEKRK